MLSTDFSEYGNCFTEVRVPHARKVRTTLFFDPLEIPDGQCCGKEKNQVRALVVVEIGRRSEEEAVFLEVFQLEKTDRAEINEREAAVAQQDDISRVQISVVKVVFQYLSQN